MKKYIIANWKMNPSSMAQADGILESIDEFLAGLSDRKELSLVICPPFVFLEEVAKRLGEGHLEHQAELGAQDIAVQDEGALTGEVSGLMLAKLGVRYVIVGHSERRWKLGESDAIVNEKLKAALRSDLTPIVCLGERTRVDDWQSVLARQAERTFAGLTADEIAHCLIAYEPVWAISSTPGSRPDTPENALRSIEIIKNTFVENGKLTIENLPQVLYGGSITPANARDFISRQEFAGVLVGGASVRKDEFVQILEIASRM